MGLELKQDKTKYMQWTNKKRQKTQRIYLRVRPRRILQEGKDAEVDKGLGKWFSIVTKRGVRKFGPMLKCKAEELGKKLGQKHENLKVTKGWFSRWKKPGHRFKKVHAADKWKFE
ncbi:hypothetical protein ILUMI_17009 [Ignelater luminosus]|uniref:HTH CENPB-type domain-containing protein n=1 Tax=Ignelater luminosus TaxID=2038154 RepID=A0A8K0CKN2_IGNLU|nr:hypothetical protein ILUMI_17009 [Ignelater luminosus]